MGAPMQVKGLLLLLPLLLFLPDAVRAQQGGVGPATDVDGRSDSKLGAEIGGKASELTVKSDIDVNVTMDINFDGKLDESDDALEDARSAIIIANLDGAYDSVDPFDEPAQRMPLSVKDPITQRTVTLKRSSPNVHVFASKSGGADIFKVNQNVVSNVPVGDYWVEGGRAASQAVGDEYIEAVAEHGERGAKKLPADRVKITVLWVNLKPSLGGAGSTLLPPPLYEHRHSIEQQQGHALLGLHRSTANSSDGLTVARGTVQFEGEILPQIKDRNAFGRPITSKLAKLKKGTRATAEFGFIFRRLVHYVWQDNLPDRFESQGFVPDDSPEFVQDTNPDWDGTRSLIVDDDGPGLVPFFKKYGPDLAPILEKEHVIGQVGNCEKLNAANIYHLRDNFVTFVVFQGASGQPAQRVSAKQRYSFSTDIGFDTADRATFLVDRPNDGKGHNEFAFNSQLNLANLGGFGLPAPQITDVSLDKIDGVAIPKGRPPWRLPYSGRITLTVTGTGLAGTFSMIELIPGHPREVPLTSVVRFDPSGVEFSDTTRVEVTFCTGLADYVEQAAQHAKPRLPPSPFPYILKFKSPAGQVEYPRGQFITLRQAMGAQRTIRIEAITPQPDATPYGKQIITLRNTLNQPQALKGWQIDTIDLKPGKSSRRQQYIFGQGINADPVLAPATTTNITLNAAQPFDYENNGSLVFLVRRDRKTIEDFVGYQKEDVEEAKPLTFP